MGRRGRSQVKLKPGLQDLKSGLSGLTSVPSELKLAPQINNYLKSPISTIQGLILGIPVLKSALSDCHLVCQLIPPSYIHV